MTFAFEAIGTNQANGTTVSGFFGFSDEAAPRSNDQFNRLFDGNVFASGVVADNGNSAFRGQIFSFDRSGVVQILNTPDVPIADGGDGFALFSDGFGPNGDGFLVQLSAADRSTFISTALPSNLPNADAFDAAFLTLNLDGATRNSFAITSLQLVDGDVSAVPLPASLVFLASGLAGLGFVSRRRKIRARL